MQLDYCHSWFRFNSGNDNLPATHVLGTRESYNNRSCRVVISCLHLCHSIQFRKAVLDFIIFGTWFMLLFRSCIHLLYHTGTRPHAVETECTSVLHFHSKRDYYRVACQHVHTEKIHKLTIHTKIVLMYKSCACRGFSKLNDAVPVLLALSTDLNINWAIPISERCDSMSLISI